MDDRAERSSPAGESRRWIVSGPEDRPVGAREGAPEISSQRVWRSEGREVLRELGEGLDDLHLRTSTPITARRPWLQAWIDCFPVYQPVAVAITGPGGDTAAAALLAVRGRRLATVVECGVGLSDSVLLPADGEESAQHLAEALVQDLGGRSGPWRLRLTNVSAQDQVVGRFEQQLRHARLVDGDVSPMLVAAPEARFDELVSSSHRRGVRRIRNRMVREELDPVVDHVGDPAAIASLLPEVERIYRARDQHIGRACALDSPSHLEFFRRVVLDHAALGQVRLTTLQLQGRLAAWVLCFVEGDAQRMWSTRFDPAWDRVSPGKLAMEASVEHAIDTGSTVYDFMRGEERYKSSYANERAVAQELYAASGRTVVAATDAVLATRARVRRWDEAGGRRARVVQASRRLRGRVGA